MNCLLYTSTIATSKAQVSVLHNQLDSEIGISIEPERKDTFPAIALAMAYLHDVKKVGLDEPVAVSYTHLDVYKRQVLLWKILHG